MKTLCKFLGHKFVHVDDYLSGIDEKYNQFIIHGLWQCKRCGELSKGICGNGAAIIGIPVPKIPNKRKIYGTEGRNIRI